MRVWFLCVAFLVFVSESMGAVSDTVLDREEGDVYTMTYDDPFDGMGRPDPSSMYDLVSEAGDTALAVLRLGWRGRVTLSRRYFADRGGSCDTVVESFVCEYVFGRPQGSWRHVVASCGEVLVDESSEYREGVRVFGSMHRVMRW